ncbi:unnamed protein product [Chilo suppressalis]|uniref:G-protein coupled receptors family 2 profile 2 domain-containing protein n=1 Tax=Chilo suppressalis TaxID=168631 RepID=A0ABN8B7C5_CHISP|nr:unnamed protein product [Chilo suppressalis]
MINIILQLNILRVSILQMYANVNHFIAAIARKEFRTAIMMLLLLEVYNVLGMLNTPATDNLFLYGLWNFTNDFLRSFQGFFLAMIHCFMDDEVHMAIRYHLDHRRARGQLPRRPPPPRPPPGSSFATVARSPDLIEMTHPQFSAFETYSNETRFEAYSVIGLPNLMLDCRTLETSV